MLRERSTTNPHGGRDGWIRLALAVWALVLFAVCVRTAVQPHKRTLYPTWAAAGGQWLSSGDAYGPVETDYLDTYRYAPPVTPLLVPWSLLNDRVGNVLWRLLGAAAFLGAFAWWLRTAAPWRPAPRQQAMLYLLLVPLSLSSLNNGQANLILAALLLTSLASVPAGRWGLAAFCIAWATALKGYPLAVGLLLAAAYPRRFALRLPLALAVVAALPFLFQHPAYVVEQYGRYAARLVTNEGRHNWPDHMAYRDLRLLLRIWNVPCSAMAYLALQLLSAAGAAVVVVLGRARNWPMPRTLLAVLLLGTCWMMLCGPATESATYVLLAPALAWWLLQAHGQSSPASRWLAEQGAGLLFLCVLAGLTPAAGRFHSLALQPLGVLLLLGSYLGVELPGARRSAHAAPGPAGSEEGPPLAA